MAPRVRLFATGISVLVLFSGGPPGARGVMRAQNAPPAIAPITAAPVAFGISPAARDFPEAAAKEAEPGPEPIKSGPTPRIIRSEQPDAVPSPDAAVQTFNPEIASVPSPSTSFDGISNQDNFNNFGFRVSPPDTVGDVGPHHYVQMVNLLVRVFDKTGSPLTAPFRLSDLWAGVGGQCAAEDAGDPIVMYDPLADRWVLSQFAFASPSAPPYFECIAVSQTSDPAGAYYLYAFVTPGRNFPDYPKLGVWPDAYYMTTNQFLNGAAFNGAGVFAFDRTKMLAGDPTASLVYFNLNLTDFPEGIAGLLPSDLDGLTTPSPGTPNVFAYFIAGEFGDPIDGLRLFDFHVDFSAPASSTFAERAESPVAVAAFNPLDPVGRRDIEQPPPAGAALSLDSISDRLMHRLAYRNFGTHESLVVNHTVNAGTGTTLATHQAGVRYYELRNGGGGFSVNEQATFAPDTDNRWMGSAAIDHQGNLAVGYSVSSLTTFPSIRYAGRLATDPPGGLFQGETSLIAGSGVQRSTGNRWGDYSALSVDPSDDCTFWYTNEYYTAASQASSIVGWLTRIGSFRFPSCTAAPKGTLSGVVTDAGTGAPIPGAVVSTEGGISRTTDGAGDYSMVLAPGTYTVTASAFAHTATSASVTISDGGTTVQDFALMPIPVIIPAETTLTKESCALNGVVDPNETVTAEFALQNIGAANALPLFATLQASGGVVGPSAPHSYGIMRPGDDPVSRKFTFTAAVPCGGTVVATLRLSDDSVDRGAVTFTFEVGGVSPVSTSATYSSGNLGVPITDLSTVEVPIFVPDLGVVDDVNVRVRLNHTFDADLTIALVSPDGTVVDLASGHGGAGDNFGAGGTDCSGQPTVFDDAAAVSIAGSAAPFAGSFRPASALSAFNGKASQGVWRLRVTDGFALDQGTLYCVQLEINRRARMCCTAGGTPALMADTATVRAESFAPANDAPDPGETVRMDLGLRNIGGANTSRLVATLLSTGGVSAPSPSKNYGELHVGGAANAREFVFQAHGSCGGTITPTLQLRDGNLDLGTVSYTITLGGAVSSSSTAANPDTVIINDSPRVSGVAPATPYPSTIDVSGLAGTVTNVTATLLNLAHTFPSDVDVLLVGPAGQAVILLSDAGGGTDIVGQTLTFDDGAVATVPTPIVSGTYRPTNIGAVDTFPAPAPGGAASALAAFNGTNPNGTWRLFVVDDAGFDAGAIAGGWSLTITTRVPVCAVP